MVIEYLEPNSVRWLNIKDLPNEMWVDIVNYEKLYQISNYGRVKGLKRNIILREGYNKKGYSQVCLTKNNKKKTFKVHRLVAKAFIPNHSNLPEVNHKDENKRNNVTNNLEWCDCGYNINYSLAKKVAQYDTQNNYIRTWDSIAHVVKDNKYSSTFISRCCKNKCETAYGYKWKYIN